MSLLVSSVDNVSIPENEQLSVARSPAPSPTLSAVCVLSEEERGEQAPPFAKTEFQKSL